MKDFIPRTMTPTLEKILKIYPIATLTGPRQSGKTTLCRELYRKMPYISLEDSSIRSLIETDTISYLNQFKEGLIIDEAQIFPELFSSLQVIVDEDRLTGNSRKFILTGSNNFSLLHNVSQSMAGRTGLLHLLPLSIHELVSSGHDVSTSEFIVNGGYPHVWTAGTEYRETILNNYIDTYVERDVRRLMNVKDMSTFIKFIQLCAGRIGTELNKSSLSVELGVSVPTIDSWINVLMASFVIFLLPPWHTNINKRLTKSPKLYFYDTGLASNLLGISTVEHLNLHPLKGALFENMVILDIIKRRYNRGLKSNLYFYRDKTGREIDIIEDNGLTINAYEIKSATKFNPDFFRHIRYLKKLLPDRVKSTGVIYDGSQQLPSTDEGIFNYRSDHGSFI